MWYVIVTAAAGRVAGRLVHVPRGPGAAPARHDALVGVEHDLVAVVLEAAEGGALRGVRVGEGGQRVVGVGGHDQRVEPLSAAVRGPDRHAGRVAGHALGRLPGAERAVGQARQQAVHVGAGPAGDRAPGVRLAEADQTVVVEEPEQVVDRVLQRAPGRRGPHGGRDRDEEVVAERGPEATVGEVLAEGHARRRGPVEDRPRVAVEAQDVGEHPEVAGACREAPLGEEAARAARPELHVAGPAGGRERHVARLRLDAELVEQAHQARVGRLVVDDEPGVDVDRSGRGVHGDRGHVPARGRVALEDGDVVAVAVQGPGGGQAAHPGADDRDPHRAAACARIVERAPHAGRGILGDLGEGAPGERAPRAASSR